MHKGHILYLSYDGLTDPLGQSQVLPYVKGLSAEGYRFTLISFEKPARYLQFKTIIEQECKVAGIKWVPKKYTKSPPVFSTLKDLWVMRREIESIHKTDPVQLLHCRSYLTSLLALPFKKKYGVPFIFDMRGFWADERVDGKIWNLNNPVYRFIYNFFKRKEKQFLLHSDAVVSLTHVGKAELPNLILKGIEPGNSDYEQWKKLADTVQSKTTVIPCAADMVHFDYRRITDADKVQAGIDYGIDIKQEYLGYVGSLGTWYMVEEMVAFYSSLLKKEPQVRFLVLSQDEPSIIAKYFAQYNIPENYLVHRTVSRRDMPVMISLMKASVFFIMPVYSKKASSPTKQGELMGMGVPIICNDGAGDTGSMVNKSGVGFVFSSLNKTVFSRSEFNWKSILRLNAEPIRNSSIKFYSLEEGVGNYKNIYADLRT